jgi:peptidylprolyl isomerase
MTPPVLVKERKSMKRLLAAGALVLAGLVPAAAQQANDPQNTVFLDTKDGRITIRLRPDLAPKHVEQIKALTSAASTTASCSTG